MTYDAVIFDLFGTLIYNFDEREYKQGISAMARAAGANEEDFVCQWRIDLDDRMKGRFGGYDDNIRHACIEIGATPTPERLAKAAQIRLDFTRRSFSLRPTTMETISHLRSAGHKIGLITDCTGEIPILWPQTDLAPLFDALVFSCVEGVKKPDPKIYEIACERLGVRPEKCVYVGDGSSQELAGAQGVGMRPVLIEGPAIDFVGVDRSDANGWPGDRIRVLDELLGLIV